MCGRFTLIKTDWIYKRHGVNLHPRYNIAPSQKIIVIAEGFIERKWSFSPSWSQKNMNLINARLETIDLKPSFKHSKRCLIPMDGWFEWGIGADTKKKEPFYHYLDGEPFYTAGIYNEHGCAIVTEKASDSIGHIHHRQPFILDGSIADLWLSKKKIMSKGYLKRINFFKVSSYVNNPRNDGSKCLDPVI